MGYLDPKYAIRKRLADDATVAGYVSSRIMEMVAPENMQRPYLLFEGMDGEHDRVMSGTTGMAWREVDVTAVADSPETCTNIMEAVRLELEDFRGSVTEGSDSVTLEYVTKESEDEDYLPPGVNENIGTFLKTITFRAWYRSATA